MSIKPAGVERRPPTALLVKWADMAARSRLEAAMRPWKLSSGQLLLLSTLERMGCASAAELARALHLTPQAMTTLLRPLEDRRVITRRTDPDNGRRLSLSLSDQGRQLLTEVRVATDEVDLEMTSVFSAKELEQLRTLLGRIAAGPR